MTESNVADFVVDAPTVSNKHCVIFGIQQHGKITAVLKNLSRNGTYINNSYVQSGEHHELADGDHIHIHNVASFVFRDQSHANEDEFRKQYSVVSLLGRGRFATVYQAIKRSTGTGCAVKHIKRKIRGRQGRMNNLVPTVDALQQEVAVLIGVNHPNVLRLEDAFSEADSFYLVLELATDGDLFHFIIEHGKLLEVEARNVFGQLFQAVRYLHERGIVHRDIKPENILLADRDLTIKLADFGLAMVIGERHFSKALYGTPSYLAPELLRTNSRRCYTRAVDVWSLGVVLYICLAGFPPFSDELCTPEKPFNLTEQILAGRFDYPSPFWDAVGDAVLHLIDCMLTVPSERRITIDGCLAHIWMMNCSDGHVE